MHPLDIVERRKMVTKTGTKTVKSKAVTDYTRHMGGADISNQILTKFQVMWWYTQQTI